jgi:hypothetical protein
MASLSAGNKSRMELSALRVACITRLVVLVATQGGGNHGNGGVCSGRLIINNRIVDGWLVGWLCSLEAQCAVAE